MIRRAVRLAQPLSAYLELTYLCNWRCVFCYNPRHFDLKRMSAARWIEVLDDLRELGSLNIALTGGEPLTHPEFFEIAKAVSDRHFALRIFSNGSLIDAVTADRIAAITPYSVEMSLHGSTPDVHDRVTMRPGSFDSMLGAVKLLRERGVRVKLKTPLCSINEHQLDEMIALVDGLGVAYNIDPNMSPTDDGDSSPLKFRISRETRQRIMVEELKSGSIVNERVEGGHNCGLGRTTIAVDPEGNVYPCLSWKQDSIGNVRETRLRDLWHHSPARERAAQISQDANDKLVAAGGESSEFPFCPAVASRKTGDPLALHDEFLEDVALYRQLKQEALLTSVQ